MTLNPKKRFQDSVHAKPWHELVLTDRFTEAASAAMLQMQCNLPAPNDMGTASANSFRLEGARQFLSILMNLTEKNTEPTRTQTTQLHYDA